MVKLRVHLAGHALSALRHCKRNTVFMPLSEITNKKYY